MSATINEGKITAVALKALQERDRELWLWLTGMRRHILVFELVAKAGRSGEEGRHTLSGLRPLSSSYSPR